MRAYKKVIASGLVLGALACYGSCNATNSLAGGSLENTIVRGVPISVKVAAGGDDASDSLSTLIKTNNGKYILCFALTHSPSYDLTNAATLIEASMKEEKQIEIERYKTHGKYPCIMKSVSAYGRTINVD